MKNLYTGLIITLAVAASGFIVAPKADAQAIIQTNATTCPGLMSANPIVLSQPAVIESTPVVAPTVLSAPVVINTGWPFGWGWRHHRRWYGYGYGYPGFYGPGMGSGFYNYGWF
jgi:hypothetical protein